MKEARPAANRPTVKCGQFSHRIASEKSQNVNDYVTK